MNNLEKYINAFCETFLIEAAQLQDLQYRGIPEWDSAGHMALISEIETVFDLMLDTDDVIGFSSYQKGMEILKKYDVAL